MTFARKMHSATKKKMYSASKKDAQCVLKDAQCVLKDAQCVLNDAQNLAGPVHACLRPLKHAEDGSGLLTLLGLVFVCCWV